MQWSLLSSKRPRPYPLSRRSLAIRSKVHPRRARCCCVIRDGERCQSAAGVWSGRPRIPHRVLRGERRRLRPHGPTAHARRARPVLGKGRFDAPLASTDALKDIGHKLGSAPDPEMAIEARHVLMGRGVAQAETISDLLLAVPL